MTRIAYLSLHWPRLIESGVGKKIYQQISLWRDAGHEVRFFMHTHPFPDSQRMVEGSYYRYWSGNGVMGFLRTEFSRSATLRKMIKDVAEYRPNIIYLRWGMYVVPLGRFSRIAPLVVEINTNDVQQHLGLGKVYYYYNRLTRSIILRSAVGFVSVSEELAQHHQFKKYHKPTIVIGNGYEITGIQPLIAPQNNTPRLVFIGSPDNIWHGIDKLVSFARSFPDIRVDIIGYDRIPGQEGLPGNLYLHGYLQSEDYIGLLQTADAAFGSLALHRIGLNEASTLKTRESLAYGLPLILAYRDTDLDELDCDFLLKIPNRENNLVTHGKTVRDFAYRIRGVRVDRQLIAPHIDAKIKEQKRLAFLKRFV
jgi:hypothetical protein